MWFQTRPGSLPAVLGPSGYRDFPAAEILASRIPGSVAIRYDGPVHVVHLWAKDV